MGFEPLHFPLSSSDGQVGILNPFVVSLSTWFVALQTAQPSQCRAIRGQTIRNDFIRNMALVLEHLPEQFYRGGLVPPLLGEDIKDFSLLVDGTPHVHALTVDADHHLVEMPDAVGTFTLASLSSQASNSETS